MSRRLIFAPEASTDLESLFDFIADDNGAQRAMAYIDRIQDYCRGFLQFPERGAAHNDLGPGLRTIRFEGRITIAFHFDERTVIIDRILYGGRDWLLVQADPWLSHRPATIRPSPRPSFAPKGVGALINNKISLCTSGFAADSDYPVNRRLRMVVL